MSKSWLLVNSNFLLEWAAVHWLQFAQQAETTDVRWWLPAGTAQTLQHPWALLGKQGWSPPVWFTAVWWAHTVSLLLPHPSLTAVTKENKPHTDLNRPQGSPKADLEDVLLFQLALIAAPSIQPASCFICSYNFKSSQKHPLSFRTQIQENQDKATFAWFPNI